jgi:hypothetical protein
MPQRKKRKTVRQSPKSAKAKKRVTPEPRPRVKSLLILECDSYKLAAQSMSMAEEIQTVAQLLAPKVKIQVVKTTTEEVLKSQFASFAENKYRFGIIVVVGHSNTYGLSLTSDRDVSWAAFAKWIALFEPKQMALIACQSGEVLPVWDLFAEISTLKEIYASPLNTTKSQSEVIKLLIPYLTNVRSPDKNLIRLGQIINFLLTRGVIFRWLRKEFQLPNRSLPQK